MPNFNYPQSEEDAALLNQINRGTDYATGATERQGERSADSTRRQGQIIGQTLENAPSQYMEGARFKSDQANQEQTRRIRDSEESRSAQMFQPQLRNANTQADIMGIDKANMEATQRDQSAPLSEEEQAYYHMPAGTTHRQMQAGLGNQGTLAGIRGTQTATAATNQAMGHNTYEFGKEKLGDTLAAYMTPQGGAAPAPAAPDMPQGSSADRAHAALTGFNPSEEAPSPPAPKNAATQPTPQQLSDAQVAEIAKRNGTSPEAVRAAYNRMQYERSIASRQADMSLESWRDTSPTSANTRQQIDSMKGEIQNLNAALSAGDRYKAAASAGSGGFLANALQGSNDRGWLESEGQKQIRNEQTARLAAIDPAAASEVRSQGFGDMGDRMQKASAMAAQKKLDEIDAFINAHSRFRNDPEMIELAQNAAKLRQAIGGGKRNIVPPMHGSSGMERVNFRND